MTFSSPIFLFVFFPVVLLLYCICPNIRCKNILLMLASLLFYSFGEWFAVVLMLIVVFFTWISALIAQKGGTEKNIAVAIGVIGNLGVLAVYKYAAFFVHSCNDLIGLSLPIPNIALPIGISFFVFQAMSYLIDTVRGDAQVQKSYFRLLLYIAFFPQLIAGPIVRYQTIADALEHREMNVEQTALGFRRMLIGLGKKLLLADMLAVIADAAYDAGDALTMPLAWLGAICYLLQIYFDFSGYSDMAIGMGRIFGFAFDENFRYPYCATSITDFWRRWHISLTTWFRQYLYIPLGGNRKGKWKTIRNKWIVFFCTGLWHGASWNFILWGLLNGLLMTVEQLLHIPSKKGGRLWQIASHSVTVLLVMLAFVLFRAETLADAVNFYAAMFTPVLLTHGAISACAHYLTPLICLTLFCAIIVATPLPRMLYDRMAKQSVSIATAIANIGTILLLLLCMLNVASTSYHPFIYFRF